MKAVFASLALAIVVLYASSAHALSCMPPVLDQAAIDKAALIFEGEVIKEPEIKKPRHQHDMSASAEFVFKIERLWKGDYNENTVPVLSNIYWGSGYQKGQKYLVEVHEKDDKYEIPLCGNTTHIGGAGDKLEILKLRFSDREEKTGVTNE